MLSDPEYVASTLTLDMDGAGKVVPITREETVCTHELIVSILCVVEWTDGTRPRTHDLQIGM